MFGTAPRARRPVLLLLVFGAFLAIIGITAAGQSTIVTSHFSAVILQTIVRSDAGSIGRLASSDGATPHLVTSDLTPGTTIDPARAAMLGTALRSMTDGRDLLRLEIRRVDGTLVAADQGSPASLPPTAGSDHPSASILAADASGATAPLGTPWVLREDLPITDTNGHVLAMASVWRDAVPILARLDDIRTQVILVTLTAAAFACGLLFLIFRTAQRRLTRQTHDLVEATRTDPLTGTLNHGALVTLLADRLETARRDDDGTGPAIGVALIDLDNFTLLNDHHGDKVGDEALIAVLDALEDVAPADAVIGRYGPDEFLVIVPSTSLHALEPAMRDLQTRLVERGLDVGVPDRLPITVSAGIASYPRDATSLTVLLATVAATLGSAKASGGDEVRVTGDVVADGPGTSSFDTLQGLVFAVDTKDRYTKRHSEDVARYAVFLAGQIDLDEATIHTIRRSGLLHDVGKIGIPDAVLRKPGKLTDEEYEIVKQHVVLGDMIVRDLPDIELVRAGIRHHHERWDGTGYVDRLGGEEIPLIARILAVGDAFSAMTTSRPYRKALDVPEAIRRLEDAAGSQLDERLVVAFVRGLESAPDAPMPGDGATRLWTPRAVA